MCFQRILMRFRGVLFGVPSMFFFAPALWAASWLVTQTPPSVSDFHFPPEVPLRRSTLVENVLERNPSVKEAQQTLRSIEARRQKETTWQNPMVSYSFAPLSLNPQVPFGQEIRLEQTLPTLGTLGIKNQQLKSETDRAEAELRQTRLSLAAQATRFWAEWYVVGKSLDTNRQHLDSTREFQKAVQTQYAAGKIPQQAPLQAEIEFAMLEEERVMLESRRNIVAANLNALLHRDLHAFLPPAEEPTLKQFSDTSLQTLENWAKSNHPMVQAQKAKLNAAQAETAWNHRDIWPQIQVMGSYNSMWAMPEHRWMIGLTFDVPAPWSPKRFASLEASFQTQKAREELSRVEETILLEVATAYSEFQEAVKLLSLYQEQLLPPTQDKLASVRAGFSTGQASFQEWLEAERALRNVQLKIHQTKATVETRKALLENATGQISGDLQ